MTKINLLSLTKF